MEPMRLSFQLTFADIRAAARAHRPALSVLKPCGILASLALIALGLMLPALPVAPGAAELSQGYSSMSLWLGVDFLFVMITSQIALWRMRRRLAKSALPMIVTVHEAGMETAAPGVKSQVTWTALDGWREATSLFLLYLNGGRYFVVPKRAFVDLAEIGAFRELVGR